MRSLEPGIVVDHKYELRREIERGGVCVVFDAVHAFTGAHVALKLLQDRFDAVHPSVPLTGQLPSFDTPSVSLGT